MTALDDKYGLSANIPGNIADTFEPLINSLILNSGEPRNNLMSRGFSYVSPGVAQAGGSYDYRFAGYLVNARGSALYGTPSNRYGSSLLVPNGKQGQIMFSGAFFATYNEAVTVGDHVWVSVIDGSLLILPPDSAEPDNYRDGFAKVIDYNVVEGIGYVKLLVMVYPKEPSGNTVQDFLITPAGGYVTQPAGAGYIIIPS
jgi:hypothetical protein